MCQYNAIDFKDFSQPNVSPLLSLGPYMLKTLSIGMIIVILAAVAWRYDSSNQTSKRPHRSAPVVLHTVNESEIRETYEALGSARAAQSVTLTASVTEKVKSIHFQQGEFVKQNQTLLTLANEEELAQLAIAKIDLAEQQREYKRIENLVKRKSVSASELDRLQSSIDTARARIDQVNATLKDRIIKAPFDGLLGLNNVSVGSLLKPGDVITTLDAINQLEMDFDLAEIYIPRIKVGQKISANSVAYPDQTFSGTIVSLDSRVNPGTRSIKVRAHINNQQRLLRPGMLLTLNIIDKTRNAIMLPEESVFMRADQHLVYKIDSEQTALEQSVTIGLRQNGNVEIISGLKSGEQVVQMGLLKVKPGSKVTPQTEQWRGDKQ